MNRESAEGPGFFECGAPCWAFPDGHHPTYASQMPGVQAAANPDSNSTACSSLEKGSPYIQSIVGSILPCSVFTP